MLINKVLGLIPLVIVGGLSGFQKGNSTEMERVFTMSWLLICTFLGPIYGEADLVTGFTDGKPGKRSTLSIFLGVLGGCIMFLICLGVPAIGGLVMVGRMINDYRVCILL